MRKSVLLLTLCLICSCSSDTNDFTLIESRVESIKTGSNKIINSNYFRDQKINATQNRSQTGTYNYLTQEQYDNYLNIAGIPDEYKQSISIEDVNTIIDKLIEYHTSDDFDAVLSEINLTNDAKEKIANLISSGIVQNITDDVNFHYLPHNEKETLLLVNELTNDYFSNNGSSASSLSVILLMFTQTRGNCTGSGPYGSGPIDCGVMFGLLGASIGGSCCGLGGAVIGGLVGFVVGEIIDKL